MRGGGDALAMENYTWLFPGDSIQLNYVGDTIYTVRNLQNAVIKIALIHNGNYGLTATSNTITGYNLNGGNVPINVAYNGIYRPYYDGIYWLGNSVPIETIPVFNSSSAAWSAMNDGNWTGPVTYYPIHYFHSDGCTITGPADAAPGQDCVVIVNPASGYVFRGSSGVVIQDSTGANVPFIVSGNRISFTYPQPI